MRLCNPGFFVVGHCGVELMQEITRTLDQLLFPPAADGGRIVAVGPEVEWPGGGSRAIVGPTIPGGCAASEKHVATGVKVPDFAGLDAL